MRRCFSYSFNRRPKVIHQKKHGQGSQLSILSSPSDAKQPFHFNTFNTDKSLKSHYIISGISSANIKNKCKKTSL